MNHIRIAFFKSIIEILVKINFFSFFFFSKQNAVYMVQYQGNAIDSFTFLIQKHVNTDRNSETENNYNYEEVLMSEFMNE